MTETPPATGKVCSLKACAPAAAIAAAALLIHLPFAGKALHIDDPLFLYAARQIAVSPWDPYRLTINWLGEYRELHRFFSNPPGMSYYLAFVTALFGENHFALHLAQLPFTLLAGLSMFVLSRRFTPFPLAAALLLLVSPMYMVMAQTLMADAAMTAFYLLALALCVRGVDNGRPLCIAGASAAAAAAIMFRYNAVSVLPVMVLYSLMSSGKHKAASAFAVSLPPLLVLAAWNLHTSNLYGQAHLFSQTVFQAEGGQPGAAAIGRLLIAHLAHLGGAAVFPLALTAGLAPAGRRIAGLVASAFCAAAAATLADYNLLNASLAFLFLAGAVIIIGRSAAASFALNRKQRGAGDDAAFLVIWILGVLLLQSWSVHAAAKYMLPAAPALIILCLRQRRSAGFPACTLMLAAALGFAVAAADYRFANIYREAAQQALQAVKSSGQKLFFHGHWGWQFYLEEQGAEALDYDMRGRGGRTPAAGDYLARVALAWPLALPENLQFFGGQDYYASLPLRLMHNLPGSSANFFSHLNPGIGYGFLPYSISRGRVEELRLYRFSAEDRSP